MSARVARALLSVSDKTGLVDFARGLARSASRCCRPAAPRRRSRDAGLARHRDRRLHRLSRDARRPRQDAASEGARRHPRAPRRPGARGRARAARDPDRSTSSSSISIRSARRSRSPDCTLEDAIENIDIGGPTMVRAAAKNWRARRRRRRSGRLRARCSPSSRRTARVLSAATRFALARKAFSHTAAYDGAISNWLTARGPDGAAAAFPDRFNLQAVKVQDLRYGENPHQQAAFYRDEPPAPGSDRDVPPAAGQGAVVQQHRRRRRGVGMREDASPTPRVRDRQARQSLRRRDRRHRRSTRTATRSRPIRRRRSAASSRSTGPSTPRRSRRSPRSSSRC